MRGLRSAIANLSWRNANGDDAGNAAGVEDGNANGAEQGGNLRSMDAPLRMPWHLSDKDTPQTPKTVLDTPGYVSMK